MPRGPGPGGIPLDDAQPAGIRLRDGRRLAQRLPARQRRRTKEPTPDRSPIRHLSDQSGVRIGQGKGWSGGEYLPTDSSSSYGPPDRTRKRF